ncbi:hypothetical protein [Bacteroides sp. 51]|uniref:hypothetical protein n=1 Tax=Bacteroides sp. 51 TaxID=2302938 RepID=UPI0013D4EB71|nr:hypothetical protein [Bacteroides sp. 51]NDV84890.1 hypothetical protein [Bacteroides sp. 51]
MKKGLFLLIVILSAFEVSAKGLFPIKEVNRKWNVGLMGGYVGYGKDLTSGAAGFNLTIKGFYVDVMGWAPSHKNDMGVEKWSDKKCHLAHAGYQIPISKGFRLIPLIGYANVTAGTTDGSDYEFSESGEVHNKFTGDKTISGLDFGGAAVINIKKVNINLALTKYAMFGGVAIEF